MFGLPREKTAFDYNMCIPFFACSNRILIFAYCRGAASACRAAALAQ
jgi:hypothetical protein